MANDAVVEAGKKKGKKKFVVLLLVPVLLAGLFFSGVLGGGKKKAEAGEEKGKKEAVILGTVKLDPITMNLADGRFLKIGLGLEVAEVEHAGGGGHGAEFDPEVFKSGPAAKALDITIETMSKHTFDELSTPDGREHAKAELAEKIKHEYHGEIHEVYLTEFVMQ